MYRPPSVRNFKRFIGELTAEAAGVHLSLLESQRGEKTHENYWQKLSESSGIILNGITSDRIINSQIRLSIVSIYSGFDLFLSEIEIEHKEFGLSWTRPDKAPPLEVLEKNYTKQPTDKKKFKQETDAIDYFRLLRNSIAHPSESNKIKAIDFYKSKKESIDNVRSFYRMESAPNQPSNINFHDIKFWCQLLLDFTESAALLLEPEEKTIFLKIPFSSWSKYGKDHGKLKKAAENFLHSEYSYTLEHAREIVGKFYDSLA